MNLTHDQLLADLLARLHAREPNPDELDRRVAAALGVGVAEYRAFVAVRGALEARRQLLMAGSGSPARQADIGLVERIRWQADLIGDLAAALYQLAARAGDREAVSVAARILATLPVLRHSVATLGASLQCAEPRGVRRG